MFNRFSVLVVLVVALTFGLCGPVHSASKPNLGTANSFAVLAGSTITNTGFSVIAGNLGVSPGSAVTGFPPGIVNGTQYIDDATAAQAQADLTLAYNDASSQACTTTYAVPTDIGGLTLTPGVYCFTTSGAITGALTLNAGGGVIPMLFLFSNLVPLLLQQ